jgi:hypothetical protein
MSKTKEARRILKEQKKERIVQLLKKLIKSPLWSDGNK